MLAHFFVHLLSDFCEVIPDKQIYHQIEVLSEFLQILIFGKKIEQILTSFYVNFA